MIQRNSKALAGSLFGALLFLAALPALAAGPFQFFPVTPCRLVDTRVQGMGAPSLARMSTRSFTVQGQCGIPAGAKAATLNLTIINPGGSGYLTAFPANVSQPTVSTLNFVKGEPALANGAIVPLGTSTPDISIFTFLGALNSTADMVMDVTGYFM